MDNIVEKVDVEEIMESIYQRAKKESDYCISDNEKAPIFVKPATEVVNEQELEESAKFLNDNWEIQYYHPVSGGIIMRFYKKTIRRLIRFVVRRIMFAQNEINSRTVRAINNLIKGYRKNNADNEFLYAEVNRVKEKTQIIGRDYADLSKRIDAISGEIKEFRTYTDTLSERINEEQEVLNAIKTVSDERYTAIIKDNASRNEALSSIESANNERLNEIIKDNAHKKEELTNKIVAIRDEMANTKRYTGAIARELSRTRWSFIDYLESKEVDDEKEIQCGICGYKACLKTFETKETDCIFGGGHLKRFVCPKCGAIFGPLKFNNQSNEEFNDDYVVNYAGYEENDCTYKERFAFQMLLPKKDGIYLDYGCGRWSRTIQELRDEGYTVYGYEPYSSEANTEYIITEKEKLEAMRFDGIFSNDLLEHLRDPIDEMKFMKTLLLTPESRMSHCTGCYLYKYEETRFHTYFFTGDSVNILADKAGLSVDRWAIEERTKDPCYVYALKDYDFDETNRMKCKLESPCDGGVSSLPNGIIYGPYLTLPKGKHSFLLEIELPESTSEIKCKVTAKRGEELILETFLTSGANKVDVELQNMTEDLEFVIENTLKDGCITLKKIARIF